MLSKCIMLALKGETVPWAKPIAKEVNNVAKC